MIIIWIISKEKLNSILHWMYDLLWSFLYSYWLLMDNLLILQIFVNKLWLTVSYVVWMS